MAEWQLVNRTTASAGEGKNVLGAGNAAARLRDPLARKPKEGFAGNQPVGKMLKFEEFLGVPASSLDTGHSREVLANFLNSARRLSVDVARCVSPQEQRATPKAIHPFPC